MTSQQHADGASLAETAQVVLGENRYAVMRNFGHLPQSVAPAEVSQIAVDSKSRVHVLRRGPGVPVVVYDADGTFVDTYAPGRMFDGHGITIDLFDRIFVVDRDAHHVMCFDLDGTFRFGIGDRHRPSWNAPFNHRTQSPLGKGMAA